MQQGPRWKWAKGAAAVSKGNSKPEIHEKTKKKKLGFEPDFKIWIPGLFFFEIARFWGDKTFEIARFWVLFNDDEYYQMPK